MLRILKQPYPLNKKLLPNFLFALAFGLFIFLFLGFFEPFGIDRLNDEVKSKITMHYGLITFAILAFNIIAIPRLIPRWFVEEKWVVWKDILWILFHFLTIGTANFCYHAYLSNTEYSLMQFLLFQFNTLVIGLLPAIISVLTNQVILLQKNLKKAQELNVHIQSHDTPHKVPAATITLTAENGKDAFTFMPDQLLWIEAEGNYIEFYFMKEGTQQSQLQRNTLTNAQQALAHLPYLFRCHRKYLINIQQVHSVSGNSQGYLVLFEGVEKQIPVSRGQSKAFKALMQDAT